MNKGVDFDSPIENNKECKESLMLIINEKDRTIISMSNEMKTLRMALNSEEKRVYTLMSKISKLKEKLAAAKRLSSQKKNNDICYDLGIDKQPSPDDLDFWCEPPAKKRRTSSPKLINIEEKPTLTVKNDLKTNFKCNRSETTNIQCLPDLCPGQAKRTIETEVPVKDLRPKVPLVKINRPTDGGEVHKTYHLPKESSIDVQKTHLSGVSDWVKNLYTSEKITNALPTSPLCKSSSADCLNSEAKISSTSKSSFSQRQCPEECSNIAFTSNDPYSSRQNLPNSHLIDNLNQKYQDLETSMRATCEFLDTYLQNNTKQQSLKSNPFCSHNDFAHESQYSVNDRHGPRQSYVNTVRDERDFLFSAKNVRDSFASQRYPMFSSGEHRLNGTFDEYHVSQQPLQNDGCVRIPPKHYMNNVPCHDSCDQYIPEHLFDSDSYGMEDRKSSMNNFYSNNTTNHPYHTSMCGVKLCPFAPMSGLNPTRSDLNPSFVNTTMPRNQYEVKSSAKSCCCCCGTPIIPHLKTSRLIKDQKAYQSCLY